MSSALEAREAFQDHLIEALGELLEEYQGRLDHWSATECPGVSDHDRIAGLVGFAAEDFVGSIAMLAAPATIASLLPEVLMPTASDETIIEDWVGELSNQLLGRAKNKLAAAGLSFKLATPAVVTGSRLRLVRAESASAEWMRIGSSSGCLYVMLDFRANVDFKWAKDDGACTRVAPEGDVQLF